jgi:hypothetical protein
MLVELVHVRVGSCWWSCATLDHRGFRCLPKIVDCGKDHSLEVYKHPNKFHPPNTTPLILQLFA